MAHARARLDWDQTSLLWAMLAEPHRDESRRRVPFTPADVHPFMQGTIHVT